MDTFGKRLQWAMKKENVGIPEIAKVGKVSRATIYQWIDGTTVDHKADPLLRIANRLKTNPYWLEMGIGTPDAAQPVALDPSLIAFVLRFADTLSRYPIGGRLTLDEKIRAVIDLYKESNGKIKEDRDITNTVTQILLELPPK